MLHTIYSFDLTLVSNKCFIFVDFNYKISQKWLVPEKNYDLFDYNLAICYYYVNNLSNVFALIGIATMA